MYQHSRSSRKLPRQGPHPASPRLNRDGGWNFSTLLAATPNDGGQAFTVPCSNQAFVGNARLKAQGTDNIFFDISDGNFGNLSLPPEIDAQQNGTAART
jgi:hypothetical protein